MRGEVRAGGHAMRGDQPSETRVPGPAFRALAGAALSYAFADAFAERSWPLACSEGELWGRVLAAGLPTVPMKGGHAMRGEARAGRP